MCVMLQLSHLPRSSRRSSMSMDLLDKGLGRCHGQIKDALPTTDTANEISSVSFLSSFDNNGEFLCGRIRIFWLVYMY